MQKILVNFIICILSVLPIVNASASPSFCESTNKNSMSMSGDEMTTMEVDTDMSSTHDCCDTSTPVCEHNGACDCDNTQVSYSVIPSPQIQYPPNFTSIQQQYFSSLIVSNSFDSLYRPPISSLI